MAEKMRRFVSGATRSNDAGKADPEGFLSPLVISRFSEYMLQHTKQADGTLRTSDNWQKGIPLNAYMKSMWRHLLDLWLWHRGWVPSVEVEDSLCALLFNVQGYLHEIVRLKSHGKQ